MATPSGFLPPPKCPTMGFETYKCTIRVNLMFQDNLSSLRWSIWPFYISGRVYKTISVELQSSAIKANINSLHGSLAFTCSRGEVQRKQAWSEIPTDTAIGVHYHQAVFNARKLLAFNTLCSVFLSCGRTERVFWEITRCALNLKERQHGQSPFRLDFRLVLL